jgi:hypothetical protein
MDPTQTPRRYEPVEAMEFVKKHMEGTKSNEEFLVR